MAEKEQLFTDIQYAEKVVAVARILGGADEHQTYVPLAWEIVKHAGYMEYAKLQSRLRSNTLGQERT